MRTPPSVRGRNIVLSGIVLAVLGSAAVPACAGIPIGNIQCDLGEVWNVSGCYDEDLIDLSAAGIDFGDFSLCITQDSAGKITGVGHTSWCFEGACCDADIQITGAVKKTKYGLVYAAMTISIREVCIQDDRTLKVYITEKLRLDIDTNLRAMVGTVKVSGKVCATGLGCASLKTLARYAEEVGEEIPLEFTTDIPLPAGMNGAAHLSMDLVSTDCGCSKLLGQGTVTVGTGGLHYSLNAKGSYTCKKDQAKVTLTGVKPDAGGCKLVLSIDGATRDAIGKGKISGQSVQF